jgi:hypothetical protein
MKLFSIALLANLVTDVDSFLISPHASSCPSRITTEAAKPLAAARYGPQPTHPDDPSSNISNGENNTKTPYLETQQDDFRNLVREVTSVSKPEHLPRLLANNMPLIMQLQGDTGTRVISSILEETMEQDEEQSNGNLLLYDQTLQAIETILAFAEDFVEQAKEMDDHNKHLLGKIIKAMLKKDNENAGNGVRSTGFAPLPNNNHCMSREEALDQLLEAEKDKFTPGFLRHIEGECERITNAPKMTRESARLLEILRIIQTRVLEELGKDMGESAIVLGQLMGYDNENELLGVLDAGLTVRGRDFAIEMASHTREALDGFKRVAGGVDPGLVERVSFIDQRLRVFLGEETKGFQ